MKRLAIAAATLAHATLALLAPSALAGNLSLECRTLDYGEMPSGTETAERQRAAASAAFHVVFQSDERFLEITRWVGGRKASFAERFDMSTTSSQYVLATRQEPGELYDHVTFDMTTYPFVGPHGGDSFEASLVFQNSARVEAWALRCDRY